MDQGVININWVNIMVYYYTYIAIFSIIWALGRKVVNVFVDAVQGNGINL